MSPAHSREPRLPLQALQLIQSEVKDARHMMVGGPAPAGQLILQTDGQSWTRVDGTKTEQKKPNKTKSHIWNGIFEQPLGLPLLSLT